MALNVTIANLREDYQHSALLESDVSPNPFKQFQTWFDQAIAAALPEPNAMTLATATTDGIPSARIVLLKGFDEQGFVFFSNYNSHKGQEIEANPHVALVFLWKELERQVRIQGRIERTTTAESDEYFDSRPEGSRLGAWVSEQSRVIPNRNVLDQQLEVLKQQYRHQAIPRPPHWGGFRVKPQAIEFWQGRSSRLHDRLLYQLDTSGNWRIDRLAP